MPAHDDGLETYIASTASPEGKWLLEMPVGLELPDSGAKFVDAVCLLDHPDEPPEEYGDGKRDFTTSWFDAEGLSASRTTLFRRMRESGLFEEERVAIVEYKTSSDEPYEGLGQLLTYRAHLERDYGWTVDESILVYPEPVPILEAVHADCDDIRVMWPR